MDADEQRWRGFGQRVRERREALKLSRLALCQAAKVSESTVKNLENGRHRPTVTTLLLLMPVLGLSAQELQGIGVGSAVEIELAELVQLRQERAAALELLGCGPEGDLLAVLRARVGAAA